MGPSVKVPCYGRHGSSPGSSTKRGDDARSSSSADRTSSISSPSVVTLFMVSQLTGRGVKSLRHFPRAISTRFPTSPHLPDLASLSLDLETALVRHHVEACHRALGSLQRALCATGRRHREAFVWFGGDVLLRRALLSPFLRDGVEKKPGSSKVLAVRRECLSMLRELCVEVPFFAEENRGREFLVLVFGFLYYAITFDQALGLVEAVLSARKDMLRVQDIPDFANLVCSFSSRELASFCRVLAIVTFEPEARNPWMKEDWSAKINFQSFPKSMPKEPEWTVVDHNHDAILMIPDILARLVQLLTFDEVSFNHEGLLLPFETSELMYIEGFPDQSRILHSHPHSFSHPDPHPQPRPQPRPQPHPHSRGGGTPTDEGLNLLDWSLCMDSTSPTNALLLSHHVEVLFVLCALCGGKRREQVQNGLAELGLVDVLNDMFDKLDWMDSQPNVNTQGIHGQGCACNPKSALKIQFLRLVHNFCDRDSCNRSNKQLLLQPSNSKNGSLIWNKNVEQRESEGLIVKILKVLFNEPADSLYRFWLSSCVEAFLRGADNKDQEFVASTGLMEHLVNEILRGGFRCTPLLQINFDLLGELIKFNKTLFRELNRLLAGTKFDQFVEVLVSNLVDSNVFVRSVVLSLHYFKRSQQTGAAISSSTFVRSAMRGQANLSSDKCGSSASFHAAVEDVEFCRISAFVSHNTHRLLRDLMCAVRLSEINQGNVCVLNTALIFFILAEKDGEQTSLRAGDIRVLQTFRALLEFWRCYYLGKRDRAWVSLQYSTQLPFSDWLHIVDALCAHPDLSCSLLHTDSPGRAIQCGTLATSTESLPRRR